MNPLLDTAAVQRYLASFPSKSRRRGRHYFEDKAVLEVECLQTDLEYAAVVRGGEDYEVLFEYNPEEGSWSAECSCPMMYDCKHAFAAMLALQANAPKFSAEAPVPVAKPKRGRKAKTQPVKVVLQKEPQPPPSPLMHELRQKLGRDLDKAEAGYVQIIQWLYQQARQG
ncbi:MAG: SWIM zinc finger family protein, partial [Limisphaerales bacterium]